MIQYLVCAPDTDRVQQAVMDNRTVTVDDRMFKMLDRPHTLFSVPSIALLSITACGTGPTLTSSDHWSWSR